MEYRILGKTDLKVSSLCLGTMTWGEQNTESEAHEQLDFALDQGVNFIDTAEMYPVPPVPETQGRTEQFIGTWSKIKSDRDKIILASKIAGPGFHLRNGESRFTREILKEAVHDSLKRLQTDYIDLYQLHWPERKTNYFGQRDFQWEPEDHFTPVQEVLEGLDVLVREGKIRHIGLSNETPWGTMKFLSLAEKEGLPRIESVQNPYNLLNRSYEIAMAEVSLRESCGLLAYSPLGFGVLSGKYLNGQKPEGARLTLWNRFSRYTNEVALTATERYCQLAKDFGLSPAQMALQFVTTRPFVTSNIIGATSMTQLKENISSTSVKLTPELLEKLNQIHQEFTNPCP